MSGCLRLWLVPCPVLACVWLLRWWFVGLFIASVVSFFVRSFVRIWICVHLCVWLGVLCACLFVCLFALGCLSASVCLVSTGLGLGRVVRVLCSASFCCCFVEFCSAVCLCAVEPFPSARSPMSTFVYPSTTTQYPLEHHGVPPRHRASLVGRIHLSLDRRSGSTDDSSRFRSVLSCPHQTNPFSPDMGRIVSDSTRAFERIGVISGGLSALLLAPGAPRLSSVRAEPTLSTVSRTTQYPLAYRGYSARR